jgi:site-specific recombinase XerD
MVDDSDSTHPDNKQLLGEYRRDKELSGMSSAIQQRTLSCIKILAEYAGDARFAEMDKAEVRVMVEWVHDRDLEDDTVDTYEKAIRSLWRWMDDGDDTRKEVAWIELINSNGSGTPPQDLRTKEDIQNQLDAAKHPRDAALISMLYETGARIGELIDVTGRRHRGPQEWEEGRH